MANGDNCYADKIFPSLLIFFGYKSKCRYYRNIGKEKSIKEKMRIFYTLHLSDNCRGHFGVYFSRFWLRAWPLESDKLQLQ